MKYWLDTEFIEDGKTIDLISIGIKCEDEREYYAISTEFDESKASDWVMENVISLLPPRGTPEWKERRFIRWEVLEFFKETDFGDCTNLTYEFLKDYEFEDKSNRPEIWAYYADYDWVTFCQLFGTMMDLPKGFPMYCRDIKQWCDQLGDPRLPEQGKGEHNALADARWNKQAWEFLKQYEMGSNSPIVIL